MKRQKTVVIALGIASLACAPAGPEGEAIHIAEESAIIIWDAASKTQHFVRRASFETRAKDFGFIVPTPAVPKLTEADDAAFRFVTDLSERGIPRAKAAPKAEPPKAESRVVLLQQVQVAGYDAAVLEANDAGALDRWLKANGYSSSPELVEWYKPYIADKWIFTAFKISKESESSSRAATSAVRMSFQTERPFFPYREPAAKGGMSSPRSLKVFFLGDARPDALLGGKDAWPGRTTWSKPISPSDMAGVLRILKMPNADAAVETRLTVFRDDSSTRPAKGDLYFVTAADQALVLHPFEEMMAKHSKGESSNPPPTHVSPQGDPAGYVLGVLWNPVGHIASVFLLALTFLGIYRILRLFSRP